MNEVEEFLEHHGVKGMKWGVRKSDGGGGSSGGSLGEKGKGKVGGEAETTLAIYGGILAAAILFSAGRRGVHEIKDSGRKDAKETGDRAFKKNPALANKNMSADQIHTKVVKHINPDYPKPGTEMNCRRATMAYEMRRRGYDVKATKSHFATGQTTRGLRKAADIDKKQKFESIWGETAISPRGFGAQTPQKKADLVFESLSKQPNGARGEIGVSWALGGGHSMAYEVVKGKPVIFDNQNSKMYKSAKEFSLFTPMVMQSASTRLDNKPINNEFIKRWVTDV